MRNTFNSVILIEHYRQIRIELHLNEVIRCLPWQEYL